MRQWLNALLIASFVLGCAAPALAQTGLEGRTYRFPGAKPGEPAEDEQQLPKEALPVIAHDFYYEGSFLFELDIAFDGFAYYLTGTITNVSAETAGIGYPNPASLPYFRVIADGKTVWSNRHYGPSNQMGVDHYLEPGEAKVYGASWTGQDKYGYAIAPGEVAIEFVKTHMGRDDNAVVCYSVPVLPPGTGWLPSSLHTATDSWEAQALMEFISEHVLPGYPLDYFTASPRRGREVAMAAALLIRPEVEDSLSPRLLQLARDLADAAGL